MYSIGLMVFCLLTMLDYRKIPLNSRRRRRRMQKARRSSANTSTISNGNLSSPADLSCKLASTNGGDSQY